MSRLLIARARVLGFLLTALVALGLAIGAVTTIGAASASAAAPTGWQVPAAQERLQFQVDDPNITSTLTDFPVEVQLTPGDFFYSLANQNDLEFTIDGDSTDTPLPYEVENWNPSGTSTIWVQMPTLTSSAQTLDLYYDGAPADTISPHAVWDSNFMMVNHLNATGSGNILDSTANGNNGTPTGTLTYGQTGQTGSPAIATGTSEVDFGTSIGSASTGANSFANGVTFSMSVYIPAGDLGSSGACPSYCVLGGRDLGGGSEPGEQFSFVLQNTGGTPVFLPRVTIFKPGNPASSNIDETLNPFPPSVLDAPASAGWHDLTMTYDDSTVRWYVDGTLAGSYADAGVIPSLADFQGTSSVGSAPLNISPTGTLQPFVLGGYSQASGVGSLEFDDVQLSNVARSSDWVNAQYLAQTNQIATPAQVSQSQSGGVAVGISSPAANSSTAGSFTLTGFVSEQADISYTLDGGSAVDVGQENGSFSIPFTGLSSGAHTLVVTASASDGTTSQQTIPFTTYTAGPAITITAPTDGATYGTSQSFTVDVGATDPAGVSSTVITLDGNTVQNGQTINQTSLPAGQHTLTVTSTDSVGNSSTQSVTFTTTGAIKIGDPTPVIQASSAPPSQAALVSALKATLPAGATGSLDVDVSDVNFAQPGEYPVTVTDTNSADEVGSVTATLEVVPVSVVTLTSPTVYFNTSVPPTAASVLSESGAELTDGSGNVVSGTLSASVPQGCGASAGTCTATISGTDMYGFTVAPVTVTVDVSAAALTVANGTAVFGDTGSAPSQAALVSALGATVTGSTGNGTPYVNTSGVDWSRPGTYGVVVSDSDANDQAGTVTAVVEVVPVPVVTLPSTTIYLPVGADDPLAAGTLIANSGATLTDGAGNAVAGTISADTSGVIGDLPGTYLATLTGTDQYGVASAPVVVHVVIYLPGQQAGSVTITGVGAVGRTLTADPAGWLTLAPVEYQWFRDGVPIAGATLATYTVTRADAGHKLTVEVSESPEWYSTASASSAAVAIPSYAAPPAFTPAVDVLKPGADSTTVVLKLPASIRKGTKLSVTESEPGRTKPASRSATVVKAGQLKFATGRLPAGTTVIRFYETLRTKAAAKAKLDGEKKLGATKKLVKTEIVKVEPKTNGRAKLVSQTTTILGSLS